MSGRGRPETPGRPPEPDDLAERMDALRRMAAEVCRTVGIPPEQDRDDLVQRAYAWLLEHRRGFAESIHEVREVMERAADAKARRRRRERTNHEPDPVSSESAGAGDSGELEPVRELIPTKLRAGIPSLGEPFLRIATVVGRKEAMSQLILLAARALARRPGVLQRPQRATFTEAYIEFLPLSEIARLREIQVRPARKRVARVARRINEALMDEVLPELDSAGRRLLRSRERRDSSKKKSRSRYRLHEAVCDQVVRVLQAVIYRETDPPAPKG